jgi:biopolymer transport protein ExbD
MKFRRTQNYFSGQLDAAPFAGVFFLFLIFVALRPNLVLTPGVPIRLPQAGDLTGTPSLTVVVAVDASGELYYDNQVVNEEGLRNRLREEVSHSREPLTLVVEADRDVKYDELVRLSLLARDLGIKDALLATRPQFGAPPRSSPLPAK